MPRPGCMQWMFPVSIEASIALQVDTSTEITIVASWTRELVKVPTASITKPTSTSSYWDTKFQFWQALIDDDGKDDSIPANVIVDKDLNNIDYNDRRAAHAEFFMASYNQLFLQQSPFPFNPCIIS